MFKYNYYYILKLVPHTHQSKKSRTMFESNMLSYTQTCVTITGKNEKLPVLVISREEILAVWYVPLVFSSWTLNLHKPSRTTIYVTLPLGFSTPLDKCNARAATPLDFTISFLKNPQRLLIQHYHVDAQMNYIKFLK